MLTKTAIVQAEEKRLEAAYRYERILGEVNTLKKEIARLRPLLAEYTSEIALLQEMISLAGRINRRTVGNEGFLARDIIRLNVGAAISWNEMQRDKISEKIDKLTKELAKQEPKLAEFAAPTA